MPRPETGEPISLTHLWPPAALISSSGAKHCAGSQSCPMVSWVARRLHETSPSPGSPKTATAGLAPEQTNEEAGRISLLSKKKRLRRDDRVVDAHVVNPLHRQSHRRHLHDRPAVPLHKVDETKDSIVVCGGRNLGDARALRR